MSDNSPDPNLELVVVFETDDPTALGLAHGSLEDADIPFVFSDGIQMYAPHLMRGYYLRTNHILILVPRDRETEARELLMPLLNPEPDGHGAAES